MECKMKEDRELVADHIWTLFQYIEDDDDANELVESVLFFVSRYDLNLEALPERLARVVKHHLKESAKEAFYDGQAVLMDHLERAFEHLDYC